MILILLEGCTSVKKYEKQAINDPDMKLSAHSAERYETNFQVYAKEHQLRTEEKPAEAVAVAVAAINMKNITILIAVLLVSFAHAQQDSTIVYKKRVLESTEVEFLRSSYKQDGSHSAVGGGIGTEKLTVLT